MSGVRTLNFWVKLQRTNLKVLSSIPKKVFETFKESKPKKIKKYLVGDRTSNFWALKCLEVQVLGRPIIQTLDQATLTIKSYEWWTFFVVRNVCKTSIKSFCFSLASSNEMMMNILNNIWFVTTFENCFEDALLFFVVVERW